MTRYADSSVCPDCSAALLGSPSACPSCGLPLHHPLTAELFATLSRADYLIGQLRRVVAPVPVPAGSFVPADAADAGAASCPPTDRPATHVGAGHPAQPGCPLPARGRRHLPRRRLVLARRRRPHRRAGRAHGHRRRPRRLADRARPPGRRRGAQHGDLRPADPRPGRRRPRRLARRAHLLRAGPDPRPLPAGRRPGLVGRPGPPGRAPAGRRHRPLHGVRRHGGPARPPAARSARSPSSRSPRSLPSAGPTSWPCCRGSPWPAPPRAG